MKEILKDAAIMASKATWGFIKIPIYTIVFFIVGGIMGVKVGWSGYLEAFEKETN